MRSFDRASFALHCVVWRIMTRARMSECICMREQVRPRDAQVYSGRSRAGSHMYVCCRKAMQNLRDLPVEPYGVAISEAKQKRSRWVNLRWAFVD